jgi:putative tryptophan/tyrosine transport system substrate-binding protein
MAGGFRRGRAQISGIPLLFPCRSTLNRGPGIANLAHPGGNITGFSVFDAPMASKWLEMLTQITPPVTRVAMLFNPATTPYANLILQAGSSAIFRYSGAGRTR